MTGDPLVDHSCHLVEDTFNGLFNCNVDKTNTLVIVVLFGAVIRYLTDLLTLPVPYTVLVFLIGIIIGFFPHGDQDIIDAHQILLIFLPLLIFEGAFGIDVYIFKQLFSQILFLAVPVLATASFLTGVVCFYLFEQVYEGWGLSHSLLLGSILSATDPVAVVSIMKELGTSKHLSLLIEGESLLNDGTAIVLFDMLLQIVKNEASDASAMVRKGLQLALGGPIFGWVMAKLSIIWLKWTFNDSLIEISVTLSITYLTFYVAENMFKVSPVLAVVAYGAMLKAHHTVISPEVEKLLHSFWVALGFQANTLIFALSGIVIANLVFKELTLQDLMNFIILYCMLSIIRCFAILMFGPCLKRLGYGLTWQEALVLTWSGLRGAVGLALALIVQSDEKITIVSNTEVIGQKVLFHTSFVVIFTLIFNATSVGGLLTFLGLTSVNQERRNTMKKAIKMLDDRRVKMMLILKTETRLADSDWELVSEMCTIEDPFQSVETNVEKREVVEIICQNCNEVVRYIPVSSQEVKKQTIEVTKKYLKLLKQKCWHQFEIGLMSGYSLRILTDMLDRAIDIDDVESIDVRKFRKLWRVSRSIKKFQCLFVNLTVIQEKNCKNIDLQVSWLNSLMCQLTNSYALMILIHGLDNLQIIITLLFLSETHTRYDSFYQGVQNVNLLMMVIITLYFVFRMFTLKLKYIFSIWFLVNASCIALGIYDLTDHLLVYQLMDLSIYNHKSEEQEHLKTLAFLRTLRLLPSMEIVIFVGSHYIQSHIKSCLTLTCDVTRAFVRANDQALKKIDGFSDNVEVCEKVKRNADNTKLKVQREIGLLQGLHPDIVLGVKTRQAIRSVLNVMRDGMHELIEDGGVTESEGFVFIKVIESKMNKLQNEPPIMEFPSVESILAAIPWIDKEQKLINLIIKIAKPRMFEHGDIMMSYGDRPDGIYIIISGLVKVEIPVVDSDADSTSDTSIHQQFRTLDFVSTGNVVGEISVLAQRPRSATLTCETEVMTLFLGLTELTTVFEAFANLDPPLIDRLWRICAIRLSVTVLSKVPTYHGMTKESLLARLEHGVVEPIGEGRKEFDISSRVVDTVLIMGTIRDKATLELYIGPCYIPKNVRTLSLLPRVDQLPVFFFVLKTKRKKNADFDRGRAFNNKPIKLMEF